MELNDVCTILGVVAVVALVMFGEEVCRNHKTGKALKRASEVNKDWDNLYTERTKELILARQNYANAVNASCEESERADNLQAANMELAKKLERKRARASKK